MAKRIISLVFGSSKYIGGHHFASCCNNSHGNAEMIADNSSVDVLLLKELYYLNVRPYSAILDEYDKELCLS